jgi:hypothetical protein
MPADLLAFVKSDRFADEREFRMEVRSPTTALPDPFTWDIGDLSDISSVVPLEEFRKGFHILPVPLDSQEHAPAGPDSLATLSPR